MSRDRTIPVDPAAFAAGEYTQKHEEPREPDWIWPDWLAKGMLHVIEGDEGTGKSAIVNWLVSVASRKDARWPGDHEGEGKTGILVGLFSEEAPYVYTTARDLKANRAAKNRILLFRGKSFYGALGVMDFVANHPKMRMPELWVFDTWSHYAAMDGIEEIKNHEVTSALSSLKDICERYHTAALVVMHTRKYSKGGSVRERGRGGSSHRAVPRIVMSVEINHAEESKPRLLARTKENLRISLDGGFHVYMRDQRLEYEPVEGYGPELIAAAMKSADDADRGPTKADQVADYISTHGPTPYRDLAAALDWKPKTLENALRNLPGWSRRVTAEEAAAMNLDDRSHMIERPSK